MKYINEVQMLMFMVNNLLTKEIVLKYYFNIIIKAIIFKGDIIKDDLVKGDY